MRHLAWASLLLLSLVEVQAKDAPGKACRQVRLTERPGWASSGAWTEQGDLLIVDARQKAVLRYSSNGRALGPVSELMGSTLESFFPQMIRRQQDRYVLELWHSGLLVFDKNYVPQSKVDVHAKGVSADTKDLRIEGMWLWEPIGNDVIAFSDIHGPKDSDWSTGFVRFPVDRPENFTPLWLRNYGDPLRLFYRLGHPYITSLGNVGYLLLMDNKMGIFRVRDDKLQHLSAFPAGLDRRPQLPDFESRGDVVPVMRAVEKSTMPTGLYGWEGSLFVLWRRAEGQSTHWFLTKIDPQEDKILGTLSIRGTSANHLTVVPGRRSWTFIEKGAVRGWGLQDTDSMLLVPSARFRGSFASRSDLCE